MEISHTVSAISTGTVNTAVITLDGTVYASGSSMGQLGYTETYSQTLPIPLQLPLPALKVSHGRTSTMVLLVDGTVWALGTNEEGQLGLMSPETQYTPVQIPLPLPALDISANDLNSLILLSDGTVLGSGFNGSGQLGVGDAGTQSKTNFLMPMILPEGSHVMSVVCGVYHSMVLLADGSVWGCGLNTNCQVKDIPSGHILTPVRLPSQQRVVSVACGVNNTVYLTEDGTVYNRGRVNGLPTPVPQKMDLPSPTQAIVASGDTVIIILDDGSPYIYGERTSSDVFGTKLTPNEAVPFLTLPPSVSDYFP
jgi:alpha-tubulin suppressor-like RCC1 family protein